MDLFKSNYSFDFGDTLYPNGGCFGPLHHKHLEIFILLDGEATIKSDDKIYNFVKGECGFFYNDYVFEARYTRGLVSHTLWCGTGTRGLILPKSTVAYLNALPHKICPSDDLLNLLNMGVNVSTGINARLEQKMNSLGEAVFNEYFYTANLIDEEKPLPMSVYRAKKFIEEYYFEKCNLNMIAEYAAMSPQHLTKIFRTHLNCTPVKYLWHLRAEKGVHLLRHSGLSVLEIAAQCGFKDPYHFSRHIKKHYGSTPKDIRRNKWSREMNLEITDK